MQKYKVDRQNRLRPRHRIGEKQYMYKLYGLHFYSYLQYTHAFVSVHNNVHNMFVKYCFINNITISIFSTDCVFRISSFRNHWISSSHLNDLDEQ